MKEEEAKNLRSALLQMYQAGFLDALDRKKFNKKDWDTCVKKFKLRFEKVKGGEDKK